MEGKVMRFFTRSKSRPTEQSVRADFPAAKTERRVISLLTPEQVTECGGLSPQAICGSFATDEIAKESFQPNRTFVAFMHEVIGEAGLRDAALRAAAAQQQEGWVYVIDLRTSEGPQGRVPAEDIVGGFEVNEGQLTGTYRANDRHLVYSGNGLVRLPPTLEAALVSELTKIAIKKP
jgi:hypothetical protein